jgi:hypothetical protein
VKQEWRVLQMASGFVSSSRSKNNVFMMLYPFKRLPVK